MFVTMTKESPLHLPSLHFPENALIIESNHIFAFFSADQTFFYSASCHAAGPEF